MKAVILAAFGGADSIDDIEPFLKNIMKGRPLSREAIESARERLEKIGGRSPLLDITLRQATALEDALKEHGQYRVYVGMRHWHPFIRDTIIKMKEDGIREAIALIMAPHQSDAATGGYISDVCEALKTTGNIPCITFAKPWHTEPLFIEAVAENLRDTLKGSSKEKTLVIFTAHSLPVNTVEHDPYVPSILETIAEVIKNIPLDWQLSYQSKGRGPIEWLGPPVEETISAAKDAGYEAIAIAPLGFVSDHIETLYDIDIIFREKAKTLGLKFLRSPSLNTSKPFIHALANVVRRTNGSI
ncbi:MAG: ferrochelatase [Deltaproteobacteria bacterium]|nr:ferrochelatase [Deltaproteobacteria bacterium]